MGVYTPKPHKRIDSLWGWWASQLSSSDTSFEDLIVLFLHNHIPIQGDVVTNAQYYYDYLQILRKICFWKFKPPCQRSFSLSGYAGLFKWRWQYCRRKAWGFESLIFRYDLSNMLYLIELTTLGSEIKGCTLVCPFFMSYNELRYC